MAERHPHRHTRPSGQPRTPYARPPQQDQQQPRSMQPATQVKSENKGASTFNGQPVAASNFLLPFPTAPVTAANAVAQRASHPSRGGGGRGGGGGGRKGGGGGGGESEEEDCDAPRNGGPQALETDPRRLEQRQKQIDLGKATEEYKHYTIIVPINARDPSLRYSTHPLTPNKTIACSKRSFDGQIRKWRRLLHACVAPLLTEGGGAAAAAVAAAAAASATTAAAPAKPVAPLSSFVPAGGLRGFSWADASEDDGDEQPGAFNAAAAAAAPATATAPAQSASTLAAAAATTAVAPAPLLSLDAAAAFRPAPPAVLALHLHSPPPPLPADSASSSQPGSSRVLYTVPSVSTLASAASAPDRLDALFHDAEKEDEALYPHAAAAVPSTAAAAAIDDEELLADYEEDGEDAELRAQALAAAQMM